MNAEVQGLTIVRSLKWYIAKIVCILQNGIMPNELTLGFALNTTATLNQMIIVRMEKGERMSVLIKRMEMPKDCKNCPMLVNYICIALGLEPDWGCSGRDERCPLVPVPPHGDLIDKNDISKLLDNDRHNRNIYQLVWNDAISRVMTMPAVIEAEESE